MRLGELIDYAKSRYGIVEEYKRDRFPPFSVLSHPTTHKWLVVMMREWNSGFGEYLERCDIHCGNVMIDVPYVRSPFRMHGSSWVGVLFEENTDASIVRTLFDRAVVFSAQTSVSTLFVLSSNAQTEKKEEAEKMSLNLFGQTPIRQDVPKEIMQMYSVRSRYRLSPTSKEEAGRLFYEQAVMMQNYEDDTTWDVDVKIYFPTYNDLSLKSLRAYFSWRTQVRKGNVQPVNLSLAYIYLYELINGIGCCSATEQIETMQAFKHSFVDTGYGDENMRHNIDHWLFDLSVVNDIPHNGAGQSTLQGQYETKICALLHPASLDDDVLFSTIADLVKSKTVFKSLLKRYLRPTIWIVAALWRKIIESEQHKHWFVNCLGTPRKQMWQPFKNAIYFQQQPFSDRTYLLNEIHSLACLNGVWTEELFSKNDFDKNGFVLFLRRIETLLQVFFGIKDISDGQAGDDGLGELVQSVCEQYVAASKRAKMENIRIDTQNLSVIRDDAQYTRDQLLSGTDTAEETVQQSETVVSDQPKTQKKESDNIYHIILTDLLQHKSVSKMLQQHRLLPSIVADKLNETFFDAIGDNIVLCEDGILILVEDYVEEVQQIIASEYG